LKKEREREGEKERRREREKEGAKNGGEKEKRKQRKLVSRREGGEEEERREKDGRGSAPGGVRLHRQARCFTKPSELLLMQAASQAGKSRTIDQTQLDRSPPKEKNSHVKQVNSNPSVSSTALCGSPVSPENVSREAPVATMTVEPATVKAFTLGVSMGKR